MNRASIGVQDFDPLIQETIGRLQSYEVTKYAVDGLRGRGIKSLNMDILYGLPHQTEARISESVQKILSLSPDRVALFGYAHVPWMAKRQRMIPEASLPGPLARFEQAQTAANMFEAAGLQAIGIDHFAKPDDSLAIAANTGHLRRNFQGYTDDRQNALIGLGASSISRFPQGYIQNNAATTTYTKSVNAGEWSAAKGFALGKADQIRSRVIEHLMCDFSFSLSELQKTYGDFTVPIIADCSRLAKTYTEFVGFDGDRFSILPKGQPLTRIIASGFDAFSAPNSRHSRAI
jgi:oxygen-independent coproporphyrinogen-3 oxidase